MKTRDIRDELKRLYGPDINIFGGTHHARFLPPDVPIHVISRAFQGRFLFVPHKRLNSIIAGVIGRAQKRYARVKLFSIAVLCNHMHMMLMGPPEQLVAFIRYVKSAISYRWGRSPGVNWTGTMWHQYISTGLPTPESQEVCLEYILSHGVKEGLVAKPQQWPGIHAAKHLLSGAPLEGEWFDSTAWTRARDAEKRKKRPRKVRKNAYYEKESVSFSPIPAWESMTTGERHRRLVAMVHDIEQEGRIKRKGRKPLGAKAVMKLSRHIKRELPKLPWFELRKKLIAWADKLDERIQEYLRRYWEFQQAFRAASKAFREGDMMAVFPVGAFRPGTVTLQLRSPTA